MRELSEAERRFLKENVSESVDLDARTGKPTRRKAYSFGGIGSKFGRIMAKILSYLPLAIGIVTMLAAAAVSYIFFWAREVFNLSEVEAMRNDPTFSSLNAELQDWLVAISESFVVFPWIIFGLLVLGLALMATSVFLVKRTRQ